MITKSIFLIGRFNMITQGMNEFLSKYFHVQLCSDKPAMVRGVLEMSEPDLVIISLIGMDQAHAGIFSDLRANHMRVPCIGIGTEKERSHFANFFHMTQFEGVNRPIGNTELLEVICERLNLELDGVSGELTEFKIERKNLLLVDDNPIQLRTLKGMLQEQYDITMATSGAEAMVAIGKRVPDLIFLDYEMPVCDGKMTMEMIRNLDQAKDIPIVFLTGVRDKKHIQAVLNLRPEGYILKPASNEAIQAAIDAVFKEDKSEGEK